MAVVKEGAVKREGEEEKSEGHAKQKRSFVLIVAKLSLY